MKLLQSIFTIDLRDLYIAFLGFVAFIIFVPFFTYIYFAQDLKSKDAIMNRNDTGVVLVDRNNKPFFTLFQAKFRRFVPLSHIPLQTQEAVIAAEDKDFYYHPGFSIKGIVRSLIKDIAQKQLAYGGSTITQQLVKNSLLNANKTPLRKEQEIALAYEIERRYNKKEILEMYLNSVYFGKGGFGIEEAAQSYFGKDAKDLTLSESSYLSGLLTAPSALSSSDALQAAKERQKYVLLSMVDSRYITSVQANQAFKDRLSFAPSKDDINTIAPHFALMVRDELIQKYGEQQIARSGYKVKTTLDLDFQKYAEATVKTQVANLASDNVSNGAAVVIDPKTGDIRALVGSKDWYDNKFGKVNIATTPRQPGSSFKPIIYGTAIEDHLITAATILPDRPITFPGNYTPVDYDRKYRGQVTVRRALSNSLNIPAVSVMDKLGVQGGLDAAKNFGITTLGDDTNNYGLSLVLGAGEVKLEELTNVYATLANSGQQYPLSTIDTIYDTRNNVVYANRPQGRQVVSPETAFIISSILSDNNTRAEEFGSILNISRPAAVKTGTTDDYKDSLTFGYTPSIAVGVWVGNNLNMPMDRVAGSVGAAPIWKQLMEHYLANTPVETFKPPPSVIANDSCFGGVASESARVEFFLPGTEPSRGCYTPPIRANYSQSITNAPTPWPTLPATTSIPQPTQGVAVPVAAEPKVQQVQGVVAPPGHRKHGKD